MAKPLKTNDTFMTPEQLKKAPDVDAPTKKEQPKHSKRIPSKIKKSEAPMQCFQSS